MGVEWGGEVSWGTDEWMWREEPVGAEVGEWVGKKLLKHRKSSQGTFEFLTQWEGYPEEEATL